MVGVLIATHGGFAEGLLNGAELLVGKQEQIETLGLYHGDGIEEFTAKMNAALDKLDTGEGVYAFVDILGGTPSNAILQCMRGRNVKAFAGVNMALMIQTLLMRGVFSGDELYESIQEAIEAPVALNDMIERMAAEVSAEDSDEDEF